MDNQGLPENRGDNGSCEVKETNKTDDMSSSENMKSTLELEWRQMADNEIDEGRKVGYGKKKGTHTVLCIDASGSMNERNAWSQVKQFYEGYLDGMEQLKEHHVDHDNIAVVTFGEETKVRQRLTKNLKSLRGLLDNIEPSGPSPMFGGLVMAAAAAKTSTYSYAMVNGLIVTPKLILVSDGRPTEESLREGRDVADLNQMKQTKDFIMKEAEKLKRDQIVLHCIPVGDGADSKFLERIQSESVKELMSYREGERMSLYTIIKAKKEGDQRFVRSDDEENSRSAITMAGDRLVNLYEEINDGKHPKIGTRVEKGDDWTWGNQNKGENGTIIGHAIDSGDGDQCWVHVEWDDNSSPEKGILNVYRYKMDETMAEDVREAEMQDRIPPKGKVLAVGCRVIPGEGFTGETNKVQGTVIRFHGRMVEVRWDDGKRGKYRFGTLSSEVVPLQEPGRTSSDDNPAFQNVPKTRVSDRLIGKIAHLILGKWQLLGTKLDVRREAISQKAGEDQEKSVKQMLKDWKRDAGSATLDVLVKAICECGAEYDEDALSEIVEKARKKENTPNLLRLMISYFFRKGNADK